MHAEGEAMKATCRDCGATFSGKQEHCTLTGCHMTFSTTAVGDAHRVGEHGVHEGPTRRRCLTPDEFALVATKSGVLRFAQNARGVWHGAGGWIPKP